MLFKEGMSPFGIMHGEDKNAFRPELCGENLNRLVEVWNELEDHHRGNRVK